MVAPHFMSYSAKLKFHHVIVAAVGVWFSASDQIAWWRVSDAILARLPAPRSAATAQLAAPDASARALASSTIDGMRLDALDASGEAFWIVLEPSAWAGGAASAAAAASSLCLTRD